MPSKLSDEMKRAFALWKKVTGVNPDSRSQTMGSWEIARTFESVQEAIDLDPTEITAVLLLTYFFNSYIAETNVPFSDVLRQDPKLAARLDACRELYALLERPEIVEVRNVFGAAIASALRHYKVDDRDDVKKLLASPDRIAILRRDALRSIKNLKVDQFLDGESSAPNERIVYNETVHQWWNVNSLLAASAYMPPGIALNLIRTPDEYQCFFAFSVRNGANLFVLSDVPEYSHPLQGQMSRRPDRELNNRAARNWFPYDLLGIEYDEEEGRLYFKQAEGTAIAPYKKDALPLRKVADLLADEVVWLVMMFDLIKEKFWRAGYRAKELSYTAEMLKAGGALIDVAKTANLPVAKYAPIRLAPLALADVAADALPKGAVGSYGHRVNRWMEDRFIGRIDPETVNLVAPPEIAHAITADGAIVRRTVRNRDDERRDDDFFGRRKPGVKLEKVSSSSFGSRRSISEDRLFIARYNLAGQIDRLAKEEFEARRKEIATWYRKRVEANAANLLAYAGNEAIWVYDGEGGTFTNWHNNVGPARYVNISDHKKQLYRSLVDRHDLAKAKYGASAGFFLPAHSRDDRNPQLCWFHKVKASWHIVLCPGKPAELALFAGCTVDELPDVLRHFDLFKPYDGNHILDRIDPMEWHAENPWIAMDFRIRIAVSKRGMAELVRGRRMPDLLGVTETVPEGVRRGWSIKI